MKKVLLALAAFMVVGAASAQPHRGWDRHDRVTIPDRVERTVVREGRARYVMITTSRCVAQRHGHCTEWRVVKRDRRAFRRD